jgi:uncharacterized protein (DUF2336 family)
MSDQRHRPATGNGDAARLLLAAARERFSVAATDLLLPETSRLTEWQRLTAAALLGRLVRTVEDALRTSLAASLAHHEALHASLSSAHVAIAWPLLERAQVFRDAELGTVLVRRVEEHRFWRTQRPDSGEADRLLLELIRDEDEAVAAEAMALLIARSRRFDRFQEPILAQTELPAELQHRLVWMIAAALRQYMVQQHPVSSREADAAIAEAAAAFIADYDEGATLEAVCLRLARRLGQLQRLEDGLFARMLEEGMLPLFVAGIGVRAALDYGSAWEVLSDPRGLGPAILLRAASFERNHAAAIFLILNSRGRMFSGQEGDASADQLEIFEATDQSLARDILRLWQVDPGYRAAVARLSTRVRSASEAA